MDISRSDMYATWCAEYFKNAEKKAARGAKVCGGRTNLTPFQRRTQLTEKKKGSMSRKERGRGEKGSMQIQKRGKMLGDLWHEVQK